MTVFLEGLPLLEARPNWQSDVEVEWEFNTDIFTARNGTEQRRALRNKPRRSVVFSFREKGDRALAIRDFLARFYKAEALFPYFLKGLLGTAYGSTRVDIPEVVSWMRWGREVAVRSAVDEWEVRTIRSMANGRMILTEALTLEGPVRVYPLMTGRVLDAISLSNPTSRILEGKIAFNENPIKMPPSVALCPYDGPKYMGLPIFPLVPNWASPVTQDFDRPNDQIDFGYGAISNYLPTNNANVLTAFTCLGRNEVQAALMEDFFLFNKGRQGQFYCSSWTDDIRIISGVDPGSTRLVCAGTGVYQMFQDSDIYRHIAIKTPTGIAMAGVASVTVSNDNTIMKLDRPLPEQVSKQPFASWLLLSRFASDVLNVVWKTSTVAEFRVTLTSLFGGVEELSISNYKMQIGGEYVSFRHKERRSCFIPFAIGGDTMLISEDYTV